MLQKSCSARVYLIIPEGRDEKILYLGKVMTEGEAQHFWEKNLACAQSGYDGRAQKRLRRQGPLCVVRGRDGCIIPVQSQHHSLSLKAIEEGFRNYLKKFCHELTLLPIVWLPDQVAGALLEKLAHRVSPTRAPAASV